MYHFVPYVPCMYRYIIKATVSSYSQIINFYVVVELCGDALLYFTWWSYMGMHYCISCGGAMWGPTTLYYVQYNKYRVWYYCARCGAVWGWPTVYHVVELCGDILLYIMFNTINIGCVIIALGGAMWGWPTVYHVVELCGTYNCMLCGDAHLYIMFNAKIVCCIIAHVRSGWFDAWWRRSSHIFSTSTTHAFMSVPLVCLY